MSKISVIIPAFNCEATIRATLDSVLRQTLSPTEILVMDDGSADNTPAILDSYKPQITVFRQSNRGLSATRNTLLAHARGDIIAFLDSDDVWHPQYLELQASILAQYPEAVASFVGHVDFYGEGGYHWDTPHIPSGPSLELIPALSFFKQYTQVTGRFGCYSFCCVPKKVLTKAGAEPFKEDGAEDAYCSFILALSGPVVSTPVVLAAYRIRDGSLSSNSLRCCAAKLRVFELMTNRYAQSPDQQLHEAFRAAFASHRRQFGRFLMGANRKLEARTQFWNALRAAADPVSVAKSITLLILAYLPAHQSVWPSGYQRGR